MVKNTSGGGNAKKQARKYAGSSTSNILRVSQSPMELYACVTKMLGGNLCRVIAQHGNDRLEVCCHIGGKFRGRNKRNNYLSVGSWVLVGLRDWENPVKNCDLEYVYEKDETDQLKNLPGVSLKHLLAELKSQNNFGCNDEDEMAIPDDDEGDRGFTFSENAMSKDEINKIISGNVKNVIQANDEEIDISEL
jgi:translation initiation factor IF-1